MFKGWQLIALATWLAGTLPAAAGTVYFEDEGVLDPGTWQTNSIFTLYPGTQELTAQGTVQTLAAEQQYGLVQFSQELRYGVTDRLMLRTTLPLSYVRVGDGSQLTGLGDWDFFAKYWLVGDGEFPLNVALGLQVLAPSALPSVFAVNGAWNLLPSVAMGLALPFGELHATTSYMRPTDLAVDGKVLHPGDNVSLALNYSFDLLDNLNFALEAVGSRDFDTLTDGVADGNPMSTTITAGPGLAWSLGEATTLFAAVQATVYRENVTGPTEPLNLLLQFSQNF